MENESIACRVQTWEQSKDISSSNQPSYTIGTHYQLCLWLIYDGESG